MFNVRKNLRISLNYKFNKGFTYMIKLIDSFNWIEISFLITLVFVLIFFYFLFLRISNTRKDADSEEQDHLAIPKEIVEDCLNYMEGKEPSVELSIRIKLLEEQIKGISRHEIAEMILDEEERKLLKKKK